MEKSDINQTHLDLDDRMALESFVEFKTKAWQ